MSTQINAEEALDRAKGYVNKAGYALYYIEEVKHEETNWTVRVRTLMNKLVVTISDKGDFLGLDVINGNRKH